MLLIPSRSGVELIIIVCLLPGFSGENIACTDTLFLSHAGDAKSEHRLRPVPQTLGMHLLDYRVPLQEQAA